MWLTLCGQNPSFPENELGLHNRMSVRPPDTTPSETEVRIRRLSPGGVTFQFTELPERKKKKNTRACKPHNEAHNEDLRVNFLNCRVFLLSWNRISGSLWRLERLDSQ